METTTRPWYKKKRFIIPSGLLALFIALGVIGSHGQSQVQSETQTANQTQEQAQTSAPVAVPVSPETNDQQTQNNNNKSQSTSTPNTTTHSSDQKSAASSTPSSPPSSPTPQQTQPPITASPAPSNDAGSAQSPTALCKDNSLSYSQNHSGTCSHHGGVAVWYK